MNRDAIRMGKRPALSSSSSSEDDVPIAQRIPRPLIRIAIRGPQAAGNRPPPPPVANYDPAGPRGIVSTMTREDVDTLRTHYHIPSFIRLSAPRLEDRANSNHPGRVALYEEFFRCGLRLPLHPFVVNLLDRYKLVPAQLTPNSIRIICAFVVLCHHHGSEPRVTLFRALYKLRHHSKEAWWLFTARPGRAFPLRLPSKIKGWKSRFFFAHVGGMRTEWGEPDTTPNGNSTIVPGDRDLFNDLRDSATPSYVELLSEKNLYAAELSPAIGEGGSPVNLSWLKFLFLLAF